MSQARRDHGKRNPYREKNDCEQNIWRGLTNKILCERRQEKMNIYAKVFIYNVQKELQLISTVRTENNDYPWGIMGWEDTGRGQKEAPGNLLRFII